LGNSIPSSPLFFFSLVLPYPLPTPSLFSGLHTGSFPLPLSPPSAAGSGRRGRSGGSGEPKAGRAARGRAGAVRELAARRLGWCGSPRRVAPSKRRARASAGVRKGGRRRSARQNARETAGGAGAQDRASAGARAVGGFRRWRSGIQAAVGLGGAQQRAGGRARTGGVEARSCGR
jgi:hypothetical protein